MGVYTGKKTKEISFPLGGIGTGSVGFGGDGRLIDWEIANRPAKGTRNGYTHLAVKAEQNGKTIDARILNTDMQKDHIGHFCSMPYQGFGYGPSIQTMAGFPHFQDGVLTGEFPVADLSLQDTHFPGKVTVTAYNPFIPLNEFDSSLPAAFFSIRLINTSRLETTYTVAFTIHNPFREDTVNQSSNGEKYTFLNLSQRKFQPDSPQYGNLCAATDSPAHVQEYWFRGGWFDDTSIFWKNFTAPGPLPQRTYPEGGYGTAGTIAARIDLKPGEEKEVRFVLAWYYPIVENTWQRDEPNAENADFTWKNYYATQFDSSAHVAQYCLDNWDRLWQETQAFRKALFSSTLPPAVLDAAASNLAVLKSPVTLRLEDGSFYGWEGTMEQQGSCEGTCTHVWNYAYALPFLFPRLQRSIRDLEYTYSLWDNGRVSFRLQLPLWRKPNQFHPCVDGQMGALLQVYRDWKLSGDDQWLKSLWPRMKKALAYTWEPTNEYQWDRDRDGILEGRQHHTLDMELYGPNSWLEGLYIAALEAMAQMADYLEEPDTAREYRSLAANGKAYLEQTLFNGSYYQQEIDLTDQTLVTRFGAQDTYWNDETGQIKYQIGAGAALDQMCAQWHADIIGLGDIFDPAHKQTALRYLYAHNFKKSLREYTNPCRIFALNDEGGTVLCEYADGVERPAISVPYCEECWTGLEYEFAGLLYHEGMCDEALRVVETARSRYDGEKRNPYSEIECGSNYARSMASFALLPILSGFTFDLPRQSIGFHPVLQQPVFRCLWSVDTGYGTVTITQHHTAIDIISGALKIKELRLPYLTSFTSVQADGKTLTDAVLQNGCITFAPQTIVHSIVVY